MKLIALKEETLEVVKNIKNREMLKNLLLENKNKNWLKELTQFEEPFFTTKIIINPFEFDMSSEHPKNTDFENSKRLYLSMKGISEAQASDERLWAGLAFNQFCNYMKYRWSVSESKYLDYRYFHNEKQKGRRGLFHQGLSKLWWCAKITYDETLDDPFFYTKIAYEFSDAFLKFSYRNFSSNKIVAKAFLKSINKFHNEYAVLPRYLYDEIIKYISLLGGICILDFFSEDDLYEKIYKKMLNIYQEKNNISSKEKFKLEG